MTEMNAGGDGGGQGAGGAGGAGGAPAAVDFLTTLPADLRGDGTLKGFGGPEGGHRLARSYTELSRVHSSRRMGDMEAPTDDAGRRAVMEKMGMGSPQSPDGYSLPDTAGGKQFREWAHSRRLTAEQAEGLFGDMNGASGRAAEERKTRMDSRVTESATALRQEWGESYDANSELSKKGFEHFIPEAEREIFKATGLVHNPAVVKMFQQMGRALQEGTMFTGIGGPSGGATNHTGLKSERLKLDSEMAVMRKEANFDPTGPAFRDLERRRTEALGKESRAYVTAQEAR